MALASNVIINIPIVASLVAELPLNRDVHYFELGRYHLSPHSRIIGFETNGLLNWYLKTSFSSYKTKSAEPRWLWAAVSRNVLYL